MTSSERDHPDNHAGLIDWPLFGPRDSEIVDLVNVLAYERGMRLEEIEAAIKRALVDLRDQPGGTVSEHERR